METGMQNSDVVLNALFIDQVYERLLDSISFGELKPGMRVRQSRLAEQLGVSRQPISHALQLLKHQGLVSDAGKQGVQVAPLNAAYILQLHTVRTVLENQAALLAVERIQSGAATSEEIEALTQALRKGQLATQNQAPLSELIRADHEFHVALYRLSGNTVIEQIMLGQWPHIMRSMLAVLEYGKIQAAPTVWEEHARITAFILAGDAVAAATACTAHLQRASRDLQSRLQQLEQAT